MAERVPHSSTFESSHISRPARIVRALVTFFASGGFAGYFPVVPGTAGSVIGLLIVRFVLARTWEHAPISFLLLFGVVFVVACNIANYAETMFGEPDSPAIVLDEILGMIATMFGNATSWPWLLAGFTAFRLFDIIKPWPASRFDRMHGGSGIMLDDLAAACYANITLRVLQRII